MPNKHMYEQYMINAQFAGSLSFCWYQVPLLLSRRIRQIKYPFGVGHSMQSSTQYRGIGANWPNYAHSHLILSTRYVLLLLRRRIRQIKYPFGCREFDAHWLNAEVLVQIDPIALILTYSVTPLGVYHYFWRQIKSPFPGCAMYALPILHWDRGCVKTLIGVILAVRIVAPNYNLCRKGPKFLVLSEVS